MLRRSDFMAATYALSLVFANFGIAIAARMPIMTTTIRSSMRVKPFLLLIYGSPEAWIGRTLGVPYNYDALNTHTAHQKGPNCPSGRQLGRQAVARELAVKGRRIDSEDFRRARLVAPLIFQ